MPSDIEFSTLHPVWILKLGVCSHYQTRHVFLQKATGLQKNLKSVFFSVSQRLVIFQVLLVGNYSLPQNSCVCGIPCGFQAFGNIASPVLCWDAASDELRGSWNQRRLAEASLVGRSLCRADHAHETGTGRPYLGPRPGSVCSVSSAAGVPLLTSSASNHQANCRRLVSLLSESPEP